MDQFKAHRFDIAFVILILITIAAFVNVIVLTSQYYSGSSEQAVSTAETYALDISEKFEGKMDYVREKTSAVALVAGSMTSKSDLHAFLYGVLHSTGDKDEISSVAYFQNGKEYDHNGYEITNEEESVYVLDMAERGVVETYGILYDRTGVKPRVACYCPVPNGILAEGVVLFFSQDVILSFADSIDKKKAEYSELSAVCCESYADGAQILSILHDKNKTAKINDSFLEYLNELSNDTKPETLVREALDSGENRTLSLTLGNERYVVVVGRASAADKGLYVVNLYREKTVYADGFTLVETSIVTMVILLLVVAAFSVYYVVSRRRLYAKIEKIDTVNTLLQCPTLLKFERDAQNLISTHKYTAFAVIVSHLQHFSYIGERFGDSATTSILRHVRNIFSQAMMEGEVYGYVDDGEFVLLLHYSEEAALENRLISLFEAAKRHYVGDEIPEDYDMKMLFGVFKAGKGNALPISKMVEKAMEVSDMPSRTDINRIVNYYDENKRSDYMVKAEIENRMESALEQGEFRVFYQPKYNLENDRIDGAEILVRWYNPETQTYRSPAEFLPVFEENGFISKLDRHIYYTACENVSKWIAEGRKIYPFSVNISRVTAIQKDFLAYYNKVKRYFNIADGFITLEFTESFAYENYEYLSQVAKQLRSNGFLCSIDDFGTGYSTYNVLKLLDMDEIKFDKFFLDKGNSEETDRIILQSVIDVGKKMGLKTTQEGVETLEDLRRLREMGCKVIQGYFLAKPMSSTDYNAFLDAFAEENPILAAEKAAAPAEESQKPRARARK